MRMLQRSSQVTLNRFSLTPGRATPSGPPGGGGGKRGATNGNFYRAARRRRNPATAPPSSSSAPMAGSGMLPVRLVL